MPGKDMQMMVYAISSLEIFVYTQEVVTGCLAKVELAVQLKSDLGILH